MNTKTLWLTILVVLSLGLSMSAATADDSAGADDIVINEFVSDNATEWVELYNNGTESVDLTNWTLEDGAGTTKSIAGIISADGYLVVNCSSGWLNNGGDILYLNNTTANIDNVTYGNWDDGNTTDNAPCPDAGESAGRCPNGVDTDVDVDDFQVFDSPTPEAVNEVNGTVGTSTVSISDGSADAGATTTVAITADAATDLANFVMTLTYDSTVVTVTAADNGGFGDMNNLENAANGTVKLLSFNTGSGQTGDGILLSTLTLEAVGTAGQTSALTLTLNELLDSAEAAIDMTPVNGVFSVAGAVTDIAAPYTAGHDPAMDATDVQIDTNITIQVLDDGTGVNESAILMTVDGAVVTLDIAGTPADYTLTYNPPADFGYDQLVNVTVSATDLNETPNVMAIDEYSFTTKSAESTPTTSTVSISDGSADAGATTTVAITADAATDLANFVMTLTYDSTVVTVTAADNGGFGDMNNLENAANGTVKLLSFNTGSGQTGDGILLSTLTLEAVGTAGQTSALTLTLNELLDSTEAAIDMTPVNGVFTVNTTNGTVPVLTVTVDPTSVTENTTTDVTFTVTSDGSAVDGALVTLLGCGVDVNGTTGADGAVILSVTATDAGTIDVTVTKDAFDDATASLDVVSDEGTPLTILSTILSPNTVLSDGSDSTNLTVQASSSIDIASVTVDLSAIGGSDEQVLDGTQMEGTGTWTTTFNTTSEGTFDLAVTVTDNDGNSATADATLTAGPYKYTLPLKQGWNMVSLPYDIAAVGIDTTQKLGDLITDVGVPCFYVAWFNPESQTMESDLISPPEGMPQDTTYPIVGGQAYFVFVENNTDVDVVGTLW